MRFWSRILFALVLAAAHGFAAPAHIALAHGHGAHEHGHVHVHDGDHADGHHHAGHGHTHDDAPASDRAPASLQSFGGGGPHHHGGHAHSVDDHDVDMTRSQDGATVFVLAETETPVLMRPSKSLPVSALEAPPPRSPSLFHPFLRGPPRA